MHYCRHGLAVVRSKPDNTHHTGHNLNDNPFLNPCHNKNQR